MQLFPGRTLAELDQVDEARLYRALQARDIGRQCRIFDGWFTGASTAKQVSTVDADIAEEFMRWRRKKKD